MIREKKNLITGDILVGGNMVGFLLS